MCENIMSEKMSEAISLWDAVYKNRAPWLSGNIHSLNLASAVCSEIARLIAIELKISVTGSSRAEFLEKSINRILPRLRAEIEYACACGGMIMKPYIKGGEMNVDFIPPNSFIPTAISSDGAVTAADFIQKAQNKGKYLTRLESHSLGGNTYTIRNRAFISDDRYNPGKEISLSESEIWADMSESVSISNISRPLFVYFRVPCANNIEPDSPFGVSVFSRAVELMEQADRQYSRLIWEYESGERALYLDETAFRRDKNGKPVLPDKRLYKTINSGENDLFHDWSPVIRDESILRGLDSILVKIEDACGLSRGTFSRTDTQAKTATELKILRQRSYSVITDMQKALRSSLEELLCVMNIWCELSGTGGSGKYGTGFEFDDSIICDTEKEFEQKMKLVSAGIMSKEEFRAWYFGEEK
ncbi:MAG: phage portal protein [Oscillospiraceae bacterium]|nr:phage portal protein [Oscillospiraceae bacterium]